MERLILTIAQARDLQRSTMPWPAEWAFMLMPEREKPDTLADPKRISAGLTMKARGCQEDQIAEQLGWRRGSSPLKLVSRLSKPE